MDKEFNTKLTTESPKYTTRDIENQLIELRERLLLLERQDWIINKSYIRLELIVGLALLVFLLFIVFLPYINTTVFDRLPSFIDDIAAFGILVVGYWIYRNYTKLKLVNIRQKRIDYLTHKGIFLTHVAQEIIKNSSNTKKYRSEGDLR